MLIPSLMTLAGFLIPAIWLVWTQPSRDYRAFMRSVLGALGCFFAGLVLTAAMIHFTGLNQPYLNSLAVMLLSIVILQIGRQVHSSHHRK